MSLYHLGRPLGNDWANMRLLVKGIPELVPFENVLHRRNEFIVDLLVHVNTLDAAAALARIEYCTVDDLFCSPFDIYIRSQIGGILASQFKTHTDRDPIARRALNSKAIGNRTSEAD
jgi:hypothetical protein